MSLAHGRGASLGDDFWRKRRGAGVTHAENRPRLSDASRRKQDFIYHGGSASLPKTPESSAVCGDDSPWWKEFKEFALKGNALSLAIGVIIGAAFGKIVDALVNDIIMPILGIAGKADFTNYYVPLSSAVTATNLADARKQGGVLAYGDFITVVINFLIVAVALFVAIKAINIMTRKAAKEPPPPAPPTRAPLVLLDRDPRPTRQAWRLAMARAHSAAATFEPLPTRLRSPAREGRPALDFAPPRKTPAPRRRRQEAQRRRRARDSRPDQRARPEPLRQPSGPSHRVASRSSDARIHADGLD